MNNERRKALDAISKRLDEAKGDLEALRDEEQDAFENMPESLQQTDKGQQAEAAAEALTECVDSLEEIIAKIEEATQ